MLLRRYGKKIPPQKMLVIGQATLLVGLGCIALGQIILRFSPESLDYSSLDFFGGFLHGLGGTTMGISIVLHVIGLRRIRAAKKTQQSASNRESE